MPADLLCQGTLIFLIFHLLNAVLWTLHASAIPRRDLIAAVVGLLSLVVATSTTTTTRKQAKLERTKRFTKYFQILSVSEVVVLVLIPWIVIVKEARSNISDGQVHLAAHLLAPHLFVFQEQIALESVITMQSIHRPMLLFQYTCLANMYRGIPLAIWVWRGLLAEENASGTYYSPGLEVLSVVATLLWFCSNAFILFEWYPCLRVTKDENKKQ